MTPLLAHAPIDEVIVGFVLDRAAGPDAVEAGIYLAERKDRFVRHEIHEPIISEVSLGEAVLMPFPSPARIWLVSADDIWLVQLQQDRFHANWRRRGEATYPGFTRTGGVMQFVLDEFERVREFCKRRKGDAPNPASVEVSKIDLLIQGKHWESIDDVAALLPSIAAAPKSMATPGPHVALQLQEDVGGITLTISISPARLKADPTRGVFRLEFRARQAASGDLAAQLVQVNDVLNRGFARLIPDAERRFA